MRVREAALRADPGAIELRRRALRAHGRACKDDWLALAGLEPKLE